MPEFKVVGQSGNAISVSQKGRINLEFAPANRNNKPGYVWDEKISFALSVEEIGLVTNQLPHFGVTLNRKLGDRQYSPNMNDGGMSNTYDSIVTNEEQTEKVLIVDPGDAATVRLRVDYVKNGMGGQKPPSDAVDVSTYAPLEVLLQAGEWEVFSSILKESIPYLLGWNKMMDIAMNNAVTNAE
eukprot:CAMPEP_0197232810 /NCGR_PEP_ID=MMETSP1429-20130617/1049_1 /TAXON_ID=49237 /ORGANISM="Chaetoceros  sp., Strain UNC1202" /LENGTH=183 /DNA_ID=CAMNT_0042690947 /DNA_START=140 /DNA_END=691 /DNA_ORIENTATION=-